jgi:hypothetical protein
MQFTRKTREKDLLPFPNWICKNLDLRKRSF